MTDRLRCTRLARISPRLADAIPQLPCVRQSLLPRSASCFLARSSGHNKGRASKYRHHGSRCISTDSSCIWDPIHIFPFSSMSASAASASTPHRIGMAYPIPSHSQNSTAAVTANDPAREPRKKALLIGSKYIYTARDEQGTSKSSPEIPCSTDQADGCLHSPCRDVYRWKTLLLSE